MILSMAEILNDAKKENMAWQHQMCLAVLP